MSTSTQIKEIMNQVSKLITGAQEKMNDLCLFATAEYKDLKWEKHTNRKWYITYNGNHLASCSFEDRAAVFEQIPGLIDSAKKAAKERFLGINPKALEEISDFIADELT